jgi:hypothetical protein
MKRIFAVLLVSMLLLTGCGVLGQPKIDLKNVEMHPPGQYDIGGELRGEIHNIGRATARYVEVGVKCFDQNGVVIATGWTNAANIAPGESRAFSILILDYPKVPFTYKVYWSLNVGGAMF